MILDGQTKVYGIFGYPVKHSKSPTFQTAAFLYLGINAVYVPFEVNPDDLEKAVESLKVLKIAGVNITIPHKENVINYVNELSEEVKVIKAANTIKNVDGYLIAYNTDWIGFIEGLKELEPNLEGKKVLVIGAGGSSRAIIYGLLKENVDKIYLANRTLQRAEKLIQEYKEYFRIVDKIITPISLQDIETFLSDVDIIVNTTSVGLNNEDFPLFDYNILKESQTVVDIIYKETKLLKAAKEKGCKYQNGFPMLIYQGAKSFEIWTGQKAPVEVMKKSLGL
ncbi:shikimate dehydrogenase [Sulfurihydrogenibium subterraneum]|uniref:shikimate dehydrogenase n=1 Tax=Sulfurihydrogenibium subterraneum TaxID=171121 RepID=UPI00048D8CCA|nr:shikimate dehydrogenase [Sulfurihydrogenibium subterraneum]